MRVFTTYFANARNLPGSILPISIATQPIPGWRFPSYPPLFPGWKLIRAYKQSHDWEAYAKAYANGVLSKLSKEQVINDLLIIGNGKDVALVCYEKPESNCHRHLVAKWLGDAKEIEIKKEKQPSLFDETNHT